MANSVVLDVGKTMSKLTLWSADGKLLARRTRANQRLQGPGYVALDSSGIAIWIGESLRELADIASIDAIIPVGHGAAAAIVRDGALVVPPMDYETPLPAAVRRNYDRQRDAFRNTGSPPLADGLNLGAQLHFLSSHAKVPLDGATILLWPQYWAWFLSGVAASEVTSLGCHTDLWLPLECGPSDLATRRGWAAMLPPLRRAADPLGPIRPELARATGLSPATRVYCGLHDSNAALVAARGFAELADSESTVLSTGTWFVAMRTPAPGTTVDFASLPERRDCLVNVDPEGRPIPSARFMGGREIEALTGIDARRIDNRPDQEDLVAAVPGLVERGSMVLPTFASGSGPYPTAHGRWIDMPSDHAQRRAAVGLYAALTANASLDLLGTCERILVEGRFAEAEIIVRSLASLKRNSKVYVANAHNDVSFGALRLLHPSLRPDSSLRLVEPLDTDLGEYCARWRMLAQQQDQAA